MGERIRALTVPADHGCVFLRDVESKETHADWDPLSSHVSAGDDYILFAVRPSVDGDVEFEVWRGEPHIRLPLMMYEGSLVLAYGGIVLHDPNEYFKIEIPALGHGGPFSILVYDVDWPEKVQIVLSF